MTDTSVSKFNEKSYKRFTVVKHPDKVVFSIMTAGKSQNIQAGSSGQRSS
jgi:hypothetical protein